MDVFIETGVGGHIDDATQAWTFDESGWGQCGQGSDESSALAALNGHLGANAVDLVIRERIHGDELAFNRDREPARHVERELTNTILRDLRPRTIEVLNSCTKAQLDWVDPDRTLPAWATWNTLRRMGWHIVDTESRYYLGRLGHGRPRASADLFDELRQSAEGVQHFVDQVDSGIVIETDGEVWTTTKVLRRLAWHERAELDTIEQLAARASAALERE